MLVVIPITKNTKKSFDIGSRLIRAEGAVNLVVQGTGSAFDFPINDRDRRSALTHLESTETAANILIAINAAYAAVGISLNVYPDDDLTATPVATIYNVGDINWGVAYSPDTTKSYIFLQEGAFHIKRILVNHTLAAIVALA